MMEQERECMWQHGEQAWGAHDGARLRERWGGEGSTREEEGEQACVRTAAASLARL
jgi:hypothetical protein